MQPRGISPLRPARGRAHGDLSGLKLELRRGVQIAPFNGKMKHAAQYPQPRIRGTGLQSFSTKSLRSDVSGKISYVLARYLR
jgi:hypothetical protein